MDTIREGSSADLEVSFFDVSAVAETPATINYRIDDIRTGAAVKALTLVSSASVVTIPVTKEENTRVGTGGKEERRVTVIATYPSNGQLISEYVYQILDAEHYPA